MYATHNYYVMFQTVFVQTLCNLMLHLQFSHLLPCMASFSERSTQPAPWKESTRNKQTHIHNDIYITGDFIYTLRDHNTQ